MPGYFETRLMGDSAQMFGPSVLDGIDDNVRVEVIEHYLAPGPGGNAPYFSISRS